jgi:hypothetical protein
MKSFSKNLFFVLAIGFWTIYFKLTVFAASKANVEGGYPAFTQASTPADMVGLIYRYALSIAAALATIRIVYGGFLYVISAGNSSKQSEAVDIITSAVWGLVLLAGAYLLLNTINPEIIELKNPGEIQYVPTPTTAGGGGGGAPSAGGPSGGGGGIGGGLREDDARSKLAAAGVRVKPQCSPPQQVGCAKLDGIQESTVDEIISLKQQCQECDILINEGTGGTHNTNGLLTHQNGYKVDLSYRNEALNKYIESNFTRVNPSEITSDQRALGYPSCSRYACYRSPSGAIYMAEGNPPNHWDVTVPPKKKR